MLHGTIFDPEHTTSSSSSSSSSSKRPRLDQIPAANLDADDPLTEVSASTGRLTGTFVIITHLWVMFDWFLGR